MCKNITLARFQCFRVHGDTNAGRADIDDGHYYHTPSGLKWLIWPDDQDPGVSMVAPEAKPLCVQYAELLEREHTESPTPKTQRPPHIQRLKSRTRNNQVRLSERYEFDYMGNSYFEGGECAARIRELDELAGIGRTEIGGFKVAFLYNPRNYNEAGAIETLRQIYDRGQKWWIEEDPYFNRETCNYVVRALKDQKQWRTSFITSLPHHNIDAWFDIRYGLFWTIDSKCNIGDILLNMRKSVEHMNDRRRLQQV